MENKKQALKKYLTEIKQSFDTVEESEYNDSAFTIDGTHEEYYVFTEKEADEKAKDEILNELWAFNADFVLRHNANFESLDNWEYDAALESLRKAQEMNCESLNGLMRCLISDIDEFVEDAINADGRGHFISRYDGRENEVEYKGTTYYIYRID